MVCVFGILFTLQFFNMGVVFLFGIMSVILGFVVWRWVKGIDYMKENHPDYKGEDLFDEIIKK